MIFRTMFVLAVLNLERSIAFYRDVLGFQIGNAAYPGWKIMERDGAPRLAGVARGRDEWGL